jgi:hypothetical protein
MMRPTVIHPGAQSVTTQWAEPHITWDRSALQKVLNGFLFLALILSTQLGAATENEVSTSVRPPDAAIRDKQTLIPVATDAGVKHMSQREYDGYVRSMGHLPVMSKTYIFGQKIPLPKTDKSGHIHLSDPTPAAPPKSAQPH